MTPTPTQPDTDLFLDRKKPSYVGGMLEMANHRLYPFWGSLTEALRTGHAAERGRSSGAQGLFEAPLCRSRAAREFLSAMTGLSRGANMAIARQFPWKDYKTFVDVGTAQGDLAVQVAAAHPHLNGVGLRPARGRAHLRGLRRRHAASRTRLKFAPGTSSPTTCRRPTS